MSSRHEEKQRRRAEREARERETAQRERRARRLRVAGAGALAVLAVAAVAGVAATTSGGGKAATNTPFGPHYAGLEERREKAGVSTMGAPTANTHTHQKLTVWANGERIAVPANIGISPSNPPQDMAGLHTHAGDGTIHNEGQAGATLGQFFAVWGVPLDEDQLGPYRAGAGTSLRMWVDGKRSTAFDSLRLSDGQEIKIVFGDSGADA